ncbi:lipopolysaccharide biosynthesis protein [Streptomyces gobiensis]|uniref:lipopolysaccharide biosynthesis protein n=1 Tax=Streptomyces gobiensis TaxID=2875706 RepID=UPI001E4C8BC6|nr:lipopolysaccharide biosynthesis protein [Streptomyces gobiensis]UGY90536.1 lipopolysaccharide biosynthesis protein [Streptomyces gobiensis]
MTDPTGTVRSEPCAPGPISRLRSWLTPLPSWWPAALCLLLGVVCGGAYGMLRTPQYTATGYVVVVPGARADSATALGFTQAYGRVATSGAVLRDARVAAGVPAAALRKSVRSATSPDAPVIEITGTDTRAERAADFANAVARALTRNGNESAKSTRVRLVLFAEALTPTAPSSPSAALSAAVGGCAGGLVGGLFQLVRPLGGRRSAISALPAPVQNTSAQNTSAQSAPAPDTPARTTGVREPAGKEMEGAR